MTITLDRDVVALVQREMARRGVGYGVAVNDALRRELGEADVWPLVVPGRDLGPTSVDLDRATRLAGELEDEAFSRREG